jgi:ABC-type multidrug transport system ATPase subunit
MSLIEINNLNFSYTDKSNNNIQIFNNLSINIDKGQFIYLFAPNGSGKTTFINLLINQLNADSGSIVYKFSDNVSKSEILKKINIISDYIKQPKFLTVNEIVEQSYELTGQAFYKNDVDHLLKDFNLYEHKDKKISQLSTGISKRVEILQNIIKDGEILLLDEPTNGLDYQSTTEFIQLLGAIKSENKTIVYITHDFMNIDLELLDQIYLIKDKTIYRYSKEIILNQYDGNVLNLYKSFYTMKG